MRVDRSPAESRNRSGQPLTHFDSATRVRPVAAILLLVVGGLFWWGIGDGRGIGTARWILVLVVAAVAFIPSISRRISAVLDRINGSRRQIAIAIVIALVAAAYLILTAILQDRDLFAKTHDDSSYLLGVRMLARGRLWMPEHPLADFFDSFYILTKPVYCSIYFPGTALMFTPGDWLHLPIYLLPALVSGAAVGVLYLVICELIDGAAGVVAAILLISLTWFRTYSVLVMSQSPMLLLGLLTVWAWLRWRQSHSSMWAVMMGIFAGWGAITRPVDALCFTIPAGIALVVDLLKRPARSRASVVALILSGAAPFLALQMVFDKGVTGHVLQTPYSAYLAQDQPGSSFGFHPVNDEIRPPSPLPQKQAYYDWCRTYFARHQPGNFLLAWIFPNRPADGHTTPPYLAMIAETTLPARLLVLLVPLGLLGLTDRRRWALAATLPLFIFFYLFNPFFLEHYAIAVIPAVILLLLLGVRTLAATWPRWGPQIRASAYAAIVVAALTSFWEINRWLTSPGQRVSDETFYSAMLRTVNVDIPAAADLVKPAVILFRSHPGDDFFQEPVYNSDVAWPDDAPIIRAHDLGPLRDREIIDYYSKHQPARIFYLFDPKAPEPVTPLGTADHPEEVLKNLNPTKSSQKGDTPP